MTRVRQYSAYVIVALALLAGTYIAARPQGINNPPAVAAVASPTLALPVIPEEQITSVFYVDGQNDSSANTNAGTESLPFPTIGAAVKAATEANRRGIGVKISIAPGVYREQISLPETGFETDAPLVIEAQKAGAAIVSGFDVWTGWTLAGSNLYKHEWPYRWGLAPYPSGWEHNVVLQPVVRRREMVSIDSEPLPQVSSLAELKESGFFVAEGVGAIYAYTRRPIDTAMVEVATRSRLLTAQAKRNLVLRGLKFTGGNTPVQDAAVQISDSSNVLVEACEFSINNWIGAGFTGITNLTVRQTIANHNGGVGIDTYKLKNFLFENNATSYNNWRGAQGGFLGWATGGAKFAAVHGAVVRGHRSVGNQARGLWLDYDNSGVYIERSLWCSNGNDGVFIEANQGPITISSSTSCENRNGSGIAGANSTDVTLMDSVIYGNSRAQLTITGDYERTVMNWETTRSATLRPERWRLKGNTILSMDPAQLLLITPDWRPFISSLSSEANIWYKPGDAKAFQIGDSLLDFGQWRNTTGVDATSSFSSR